MVVEIGFGHLARLHRGLQRAAVVRAVGQFEVEPAERAPDRVVARAEVRHGEAAEAPLVLQHALLELLVLARVGAVDPVLGAHHGAGVGLLDGGLERRLIDLAQRALVDVLVDNVAVDLLVVGEIVLRLGDRALGLDPLDGRHDDLARELRILAVGLERPPIQRDARDVDVRPFLEVAADRAGLAAHHRAVAECDLRVERGGESDRRGQRGRLRLHRPARADAGRAVVEPQRRDAQPGNRQRLACVLGVRDRVQHRDLLVQGHLRDQRVGSLIGRAARVHPRRAGAAAGLRARGRRRNGESAPASTTASAR